MKLNRLVVLIASMFETLVLGCVVFVCLKNWYPGVYFDLFGSSLNLAFLVVALLVLGPFLNVLVYKKDRTSYINDLSVIYLLKFCVLILWLHNFYSQRPILLVFSVDRLVVVQAHQVPLGQLPPEIAVMILNSKQPPVVAARKFAGDDVGMMIQVMAGAPDIEYRPTQYERFDYQRKDFLERLCVGGIASALEQSAFMTECFVVEAPLVYKADQYATAVFEVEQAILSQVLAKDPW
ncbi:hypothetical protein [Marinobacter mobilis]|uniref:Uncharacterized protein n=1 Tax=Marinobacter mobilis TaxID=488533 RepID=A0A1H2TIU5_9GAMM|nr:hypothetical protein [Marinobacter mobilis]SDW43841.1 hypothetical protein SAMN04487960_102458 [Marinobacter mobilis]